MSLYSVPFTSLLFFFSLGHLGRVSFLRQEVNLYIYEVIIVILTIVLAYRYRLQPFRVTRKPNTALFMFTGYLFFSFLLSISNFTLIQNVIGFLFFLRLVTYLIFFVYLYFFINDTNNKKFLRFLKYLVIMSFALIIGTSIGQYSLYPDIRNLIYAGWDPHLNRLVGVFLEPPISGAIYGLLFFYFLLTPRVLTKTLRIIALLILFIFIFITFSRGTYVGFFLTLFVVLIRQLKLKKMYLSLVILVCAVGLLLVSQLSGEGAHLTRTSTIASRIANYQEALEIWTHSPIFGVGYNHIRYVRSSKPDSEVVAGVSHAESAFHSSFLVILVSGGIIGLVLFIYVLFALATMSQYSMYAVIFLSFSSLTDNVILHPFILFFSLLLIALSVTHLSDKSR